MAGVVTWDDIEGVGWVDVASIVVGAAKGAGIERVDWVDARATAAEDDNGAGIERVDMVDAGVVVAVTGEVADRVALTGFCLGLLLAGASLATIRSWRCWILAAAAARMADKTLPGRDLGSDVCWGKTWRVLRALLIGSLDAVDFELTAVAILLTFETIPLCWRDRGVFLRKVTA